MGYNSSLFQKDLFPFIVKKFFQTALTIKLKEAQSDGLCSIIQKEENFWKS